VNRCEMESSESSDTEVSDDSIKSRSSVVKRSPVKPNTTKKFSASLGTFDGSTCLRSFLQKFSYHSKYYGWSEEDKLFQLYSCLTGAAAQMLTCNREVKSVDRILELLETRFGTGNRCEIYRLELKNRRRAPGEKLQVLYQDICRLMSLAYPDPNIDLVDLLARDFYLDALNDHSFKVRILEREPKTLDEALQISLKLEAYDCADPVRNNHSVPVSYQNRNRFVRPVHDNYEDEKSSPTKSKSSLQRSTRNDQMCIKQLEQKLDVIMENMKTLRPMQNNACMPLIMQPNNPNEVNRQLVNCAPHTLVESE
jgi:hypothetical protein